MLFLFRKIRNAIAEPVKIYAYCTYCLLKYKRKWFSSQFNYRRKQRIMGDHGLDCDHVDKVLQLVGLPRSGTTLLSAVIAESDNVISLSEPFLQFLYGGFFKYKKEEWNTRICMSRPEKFINSIASDQNVMVVFKETWRSENHDVFPSSQFITANLRRGIKTVAVIRDPRAIWFSMLARFAQEGCDLSARSNDGFLSEWNKFVDWLDLCEICAFRYEDFVKDTSVLSKTLSNQGIKIECGQSCSFSEIAGLGDSKALSGGTINTNSLQKYKMLDAEVIKKIEHCCTDGMLKYKYLNSEL